MRITESQLRAIIKKELSQVLNEMSRGDQFAKQTMKPNDINEIAQKVGNRLCWNYNNRMYAVFKPAQGNQEAEYWLRKPTISDAGRDIEMTDLSDFLYDLNLISNPVPSKEELKKLKNDNLPVRDQFGNIGSPD